MNLWRRKIQPIVQHSQLAHPNMICNQPWATATCSGHPHFVGCAVQKADVKVPHDLFSHFPIKKKKKQNRTERMRNREFTSGLSALFPGIIFPAFICVGIVAPAFNLLSHYSLQSFIIGWFSPRSLTPRKMAGLVGCSPPFISSNAQRGGR